ncbi:hypothetical protein [Natronococcus wangiae]|uniref:hypothetical protein n=1 Tax=Natronococcus wangiae TaxID=3068275 RepID=UPI002740137F|nr:hypothetical protein [Natronococcus sp. AD5]
MTVEKQDPNEIAEQLLKKTDGDEVVLYVDDETELSASIIRPLHLPRSANDDVEGGSLRYAVAASERTVDRFDLPGREGVIAAEEIEAGSWNRSRIEFYDVVAGEDDGNEPTEFGDLERSHDLVAVDDGPAGD